MFYRYLKDYIDRETNHNRNIQGPIPRTAPGLPTIQPRTNSWICPCGASFPFGLNTRQPVHTQVESYVEFTLRPAHKPQRHDYSIALTRTHTGRWGSKDIQILTTGWVMDELFFQHLVQNPLHASAFARELNRSGTFIKLVHHCGPKDPNVRLVVRYAGSTAASNTLVDGQRWKFRHTKAPWHPLAKVWFAWAMLMCVAVIALWIGTSKKFFHGQISRATAIGATVVVTIFVTPFPPLTYVVMRVTRGGRRIR